MPDNKQKTKVYKDKKEFDKANQAYQDSLNLFKGVQGDIQKLKDLESIYRDPVTIGNLWYDISKESQLTEKYKKGLEAYKNLKKLNGKYPEPILRYISSPGNSAEEYQKPRVKPIYEDKPKLDLLTPITKLKIPMGKEPKIVSKIQELPKVDNFSEVQNYTGAKYLEKMKKPTGYINKGDSTGRQEYGLGGTLGFTAGMALNGLVPGLGIVASPLLSQLGDQLENSIKSNAKFKLGGKLTHLKGNSHENGGIQLNGNAEVETGETKIDDFIFSDYLKFNNKQTFASKSKSIDKKYFRDNDKIDAMGKKLELEKLANQQENMKKSIMIDEITGKYMTGGKLKKKYLLGGIDPNHPLSDDRATVELRKKYEGLTPITPIGLKSIDTSNPSPKLAGNVQSITSNITETSNITDPKTMDVFSNNPNYGNILPQLTGDAFNILQGIKGGDPVDFQRVTPYIASSKPAITSFNNTNSTSYNAARNAIRNNATSAGEYLAFMNSLSGSESMKRGLGAANIKAEYDKLNTATRNQTSGINSQIQMQEAIARQQEIDAARSAVSKGLSDLGSKIGSINNEKSIRNNQKDLVSLMSKNGYKLTRDKNGELGWEKAGTFTPYEIGIKSVFNQ